MIQLALSVFAWMGIVMVQFMVHCCCSNRNSNRFTDDDDEKLLTILEYENMALPSHPLLDMEQQDVVTARMTIGVTTNSAIVANNEADVYCRNADSMSHCHADYDTRSLDIDESTVDGDDQSQLLRLLDQTGSEMVMVRSEDLNECLVFVLLGNECLSIFVHA